MSYDVSWGDCRVKTAKQLLMTFLQIQKRGKLPNSCWGLLYLVWTKKKKPSSNGYSFSPALASGMKEEQHKGTLNCKCKNVFDLTSLAWLLDKLPVLWTPNKQLPTFQTLYLTLQGRLATVDGLQVAAKNNKTGAMQETLCSLPRASFLILQGLELQWSTLHFTSVLLY